jgi:allantoicase
MTDLSTAAVGGRVVESNDEFFAEAKNLLTPGPAVWKEDAYTDQGKWMDGWETRRRREEGHDWCVIALGIPGRIESVTIDTSFFTGNFPEEFSLEGCGVGEDESLAKAFWVELIPRTPLQGDSVGVFDVKEPGRISYLRLNIFPDGGVARLRVEGSPIAAIQDVCPDAGSINLASLRVGTEPAGASDAHYSPPANMLRPGDPAGMWDGWETKRRRGPGNDWVAFQLGLAGTVEEVSVDTRFFKGNSPGWISLDGSTDGKTWTSVIPRTPVEADSVNVFHPERAMDAEYVKLDIYPDGGVARLRVVGVPTVAAASGKRVQYLNSLLGQEATRFFRTVCASTKWISEMLSCRPFETAQSILDTAEMTFADLDESDWLESFAGHPRIGEKGDEAANSEQAAASGAPDAVTAALAATNREYEQKFGFTYIVYATGKTAEEMLRIARGRLGNTRDEEIDIAAGEQRKISETRLRRMLCMEAR